VVPVCGWTDWRSWYPQWYAPADRPEIVEPWRMPLLERASTLALAENLIHVPVCALHGGLDAVVPPDHSRRMVEALLRFGADATYKEYGRGKHASFRSRWGEVFDWFEGRRLRTWRNGRYAGPASAPGVKRREVAPRRVVYVTNSPRHGRAYWVEVNRLSDPLSFGRIEVVAEAQGEVRARPTGLDAFTLSPPEEITGPRWSARVGRQDWSGPAGVRLRARREDGRWVFSEADPTPEAAPTKLGGLPGPIADAFASPFLIVAGGSAEDRAEADFLAARWARWMIRRGAPRVVSHRDVRPSHVEDLNLVLCGRPGSHTVLDRVADRLPARVEPGSITVGGRAWRGPALGLRLVCPNPLNTRRYVVVWFGRMPMRSKDLEGWPWLLPDYVVFDPSRACGRTVHPAWQRLDERVAQGEVDPAAVEEDDKPPLYLPDSFLDAGFFDNQWKDVRA
jgi:hypothetical protein